MANPPLVLEILNAWMTSEEFKHPPHVIMPNAPFCGCLVTANDEAHLLSGTG